MFAALTSASMSPPLRVALLAITAALLLATLARGTPEGRMLVARLVGPDLERVELPGLAAEPRPVPARLIERARADLAADAPGGVRLYVPDADRGATRVTRSGLRWWGAGPLDGAPRPVVLLLHGAERDGRAMIDMWHEVAERAGLVLVAPDFAATRDPETGLYDARVAVEALRHAAEIHPVDARRIVLFGHGAGAEAAQIWANSIDGPWRAVAVHAGIVPVDRPRPVAGGAPVRHYLGTEDASRPIGLALASATAMARAGHSYELIRLRGHDNWFWGAGERIAEDAWFWMEGQLAPRTAP